MNSATSPQMSGHVSHLSSNTRSRTAGYVGRAGVVGVAAWLVGLVGCNSFDPAPRPGAGTVRIVPTDTREPVSSPNAAPIMGSNLLRLDTSGTGDNYMIADADRSSVSFIQNGAVVEVPTGEGSRPNRSAEDLSGFVHVVLRGTGELAMIHPSGQIAARGRVCAAPRGVAFDSTQNDLVVACAEGALVRHSVDPLNYVNVRTIATDPDVRDVVLQQDRIYVSRLRSAEVLEYRGDVFAARHVLPSVTLSSGNFETERDGSRFAPSVAWKMVASPEGNGVVVLHQRALLDEVGAAETADEDDSADEGGSSYGGSSPEFGCSSIVQPAVSEVHTDGTVVTSDSISGVVLAVDMVARGQSATNFREVAIVSAGKRDPNAPLGEVVERVPSNEGSGGGLATLISPNQAFGGTGVFTGGLQLHGADEKLPNGDVAVNCTTLGEGFDQTAQTNSGATAIVTSRDGGFAVLQREPGVLKTSLDGFNFSQSVAFSNGSVSDTGHDLFHRDSGGGIACASCHPEAEDDGHVWNFTEEGVRRTQFLGVPLAETAPFHWNGSLPNLGSLMDEVFVARMGGVFQSEERLDKLNTWMGSRKPVVVQLAEGDAAARGKAVFDAKETECASCHSGSAFTDNNSYAIGTSGSEKLQVPSLVGLVLHPPYMHTGCALTLRDRFNPACGGGDLHGKTSQLSPSQIDDLVAYLASL